MVTCNSKPVSILNSNTTDEDVSVSTATASEASAPKVNHIGTQVEQIVAQQIWLKPNISEKSELYPKELYYLPLTPQKLSFDRDT